MGALERITAAATRMITRKGAKTGVDGWQVEAWRAYEDTPEVGAFGDWVGNTASGAVLYAGRRAADGTVEPAPDGSRAAELVSAIAGGRDGQSELLSMACTQLAIAGETWAVIVPDPDADSFADDRWVALSSEEVKRQRGKLKVTIDGEEIDVPEPDPETGDSDPDAPVAIRVWNPSPRCHWEATSPVRKSLSIISELRLLNAAVAAIARSRITGRGVLLVPAGTRFPSAPGEAQADDSLLDVFIEVASTAIKEPESAAATVPIILEIPGDLINGVKWLQFSSEFDAMALQLRDEAIRRFAAGADVPAEILLGLGDSNHWTAWAVTAEAIQTGVEPRLALFCNALTQQWLRPLLEAENDPEAGQWTVWYDTSALRSSSNKGAAAIDAFREGIINDKAARRELGFTEADAPSAATATTTVTTDSREQTVSDTQTPPNEMTLAASHTTHDHSALVAAVDGLAWSAVRAAGDKLTRTPSVPRPDRGTARTLVARASVHEHYPVTDANIDAWRLLEGAWVRVPEVAARYGIDGEALTAALDEYARALLVTCSSHTYDNTVRMLAQSGIVPDVIIGMIEGGAQA